MNNNRTFKHGLQPDWQEAFIDPKVYDLVEALNREALSIRTIAACQGHLRDVHPPYVYFQCPLRIAALIEKRLLLMEVREEGLHYGWRLNGHFNKEFELCWSLKSYHLDGVALHGSIVEHLYTFWLRRGRIDGDLALLAETINDLLDQCNADSVPSVPDPYDEKNHQKQHYDLLNDCDEGKTRPLTLSRTCIDTASGHEIDVRSRKISDFAGIWKTGLAIFLVAILPAFSTPAGSGEISYGHVRAERVVSVYDGDTFRADIAGWPAIVGRNIPVRVSGIDTPEIRGKCAQETALARAARDRARALLQSGAPVVLENVRRGKYFRLLADVWVGQYLLSRILITENLGRPYHGGRRQGWC